MKTSLEICRVTATAPLADRESLVSIAKETFVEAFGMNYSEADLNAYIAERLTLEAIQQELDEANNVFYLVYSDAKLLGYLKWIMPCDRYLKPHQHNGNAFFLERFYFLKEAQGTGLANVAMEYVLSAAKYSAKAEMIYLSVWEHNLRAQNFYQKFGLRTIDTCQYKVGNVIDREYLYAKKL